MAGRKRDWCFTIHSGHFGDKTEQQVIDGLLKVNCAYMVFQQETGGELGRDHLQGYVMFTAQKTLQQAKRLLPCDAHLEMRMAAKISDAIKYCKKLDTRRPGCCHYEFGTEPMDTGVKRTLQDAIAIAKDKGYKRAMLDLPDVTIRYAKGLKKYAHIAAGERIPQSRPVTVYYVWGDSGSGKSWWANTLYDSPDNTYTTTDMPDKIWMGNYAGERTLVINEFNSKCDSSILKCMLEGYKMEFQTKGGFVWAEWDTVIITSNTDPKLIYDASINWWSVLPTPPGPFQRRFASGGIIHAEGNYEMGTATFDTTLPTRTAPDSSAAPDDLPMEDLHRSNVPSVTFEPTTPGLINLVDDLEIDDFLTM